jgi:hypothetical protein
VLFMVVEHVRQDVKAVYARLGARGRSLPPGPELVASHVEASCGRCWQLMRPTT